jgi:hypothetical protein
MTRSASFRPQERRLDVSVVIEHFDAAAGPRPDTVSTTCMTRGIFLRSVVWRHMGKDIMWRSGGAMTLNRRGGLKWPHGCRWSLQTGNMTCCGGGLV